MEISRRNVLRSAAAVGGAAAAVPLYTSLAGSAVAGVVSPAGTTIARTYGPGPANAAGYSKIVELPGEDHTVREDLGITGAPDREDNRTPVLAFAQFSDIHVVDHQSPGRVEWLDRFEDPNDLGVVPGLLSSSYRAWEMLSAHVADAMVKSVNALK
ncbi:MAG: TIGR03767 family metallophosphoesterase, partial [Microbacterium sp.]